MIGLFRPPNQRLTLRQSLGRTHLVTSLTAVCMAGVLLTGIALLALRLYADHNLELVARAISYTSEAAVVFHDEEAAREALQAITTHEDVARASIYLPSSQLLASWSRTMNTPWSGLEQYLARLILPGPVDLPMLRGGVEIARIHLVGHGQYLLLFLLQTLLAMLLCLVLSTWGALRGAPDAKLPHRAAQGSGPGGPQRQPPADPRHAGARGQHRRAARARPGFQLPARRTGSLAGPPAAGECQPAAPGYS